MGLTPTAAADARMHQRMSFDVVFGFIFITALHGTSIIKILTILYINYNIAKRLPKAYIPAATWIFNVGIMFANDIYKGYVFGNMFRFILPSHHGTIEQPWRTNIAFTLDMYRGLIGRWEVLFNFTVLRLISFNLDYYWSLGQSDGSSLEVSQRRLCV